MTSEDVTRRPEVWEQVVRKLRTRRMPPVDMPRPTEDAYRAALSLLHSAAARHPKLGRTDMMRRLNKTEYQNAIRDLLVQDIDVTTLLPAYESSHGFDNVTVGDLYRHG